MKLSNEEIADVKLGTQDILRVYAGTSLIWDRTPVTLLQNRSFEGADPFNGMTGETSETGIVQDITKFTHGLASAKFFIDRSEDGLNGPGSPHRAEVHSSVAEFEFGTDYWVGFNMYLENWANDTEAESIWQWHNTPNTGAGENWNTLKLQTPFGVQIKDNIMEIVHSYMVAGQEANPNGQVQVVRTAIGAPKNNAWTAWVIHCNWHYQNGRVRVWKDGVLVYEKTGHTYYNDETGPYHKIGIYKWAWSLGFPGLVPTRTLYLDNWKIAAGPNVTYSAVNPVS